jgi:hypothetical protein
MNEQAGDFLDEYTGLPLEVWGVGELTSSNIQGTFASKCQEAFAVSL